MKRKSYCTMPIETCYLFGISLIKKTSDSISIELVYIYKGFYKYICDVYKGFDKVNIITFDEFKLLEKKYMNCDLPF